MISIDSKAVKKLWNDFWSLLMVMMVKSLAAIVDKAECLSSSISSSVLKYTGSICVWLF